MLGGPGRYIEITYLSQGLHNTYLRKFNCNSLGVAQGVAVHSNFAGVSNSGSDCFLIGALSRSVRVVQGRSWKACFANSRLGFLPKLLLVAAASPLPQTLPLCSMYGPPQNRT